MYLPFGLMANKSVNILMLVFCCTEAVIWRGKLTLRGRSLGVGGACIDLTLLDTSKQFYKVIASIYIPKAMGESLNFFFNNLTVRSAYCFFF